jgi:hypothetical protein
MKNTWLFMQSFLLKHKCASRLNIQDRKQPKNDNADKFGQINITFYVTGRSNAITLWLCHSLVRSVLLLAV